MKYYDLHTHTTHSDGKATVAYLQKVAAEKGYGLGISDHLFCGGMNTRAAVAQYLDALEPCDVLRGVEANIGEDYTLPDALAYRLDYVISSVHAVSDLQGGTLSLGKYFGERGGDPVVWERNIDESRCREYLESVLPVVAHTMQTQRMDIYGHCMVLPFCEILAGTAFLRDWEDSVIALCKKYHIALEISGLWKEPGLGMVLRARQAGVRFSLGSDCHYLKDVCNLDYPLRVVANAGLTEKDFFLPHRGA